MREQRLAFYLPVLNGGTCGGKGTYTEDDGAVYDGAMYNEQDGASTRDEKVVGDGGMKGRCKVVRHRPLRALWNWVSRWKQAAGNESDKRRP